MPSGGSAADAPGASDSVSRSRCASRTSTTARCTWSPIRVWGHVSYSSCHDPELLRKEVRRPADTRREGPAKARPSPLGPSAGMRSLDPAAPTGTTRDLRAAPRAARRPGRGHLAVTDHRGHRLGYRRRSRRGAERSRCPPTLPPGPTRRSRHPARGSTRARGRLPRAAHAAGGDAQVGADDPPAVGTAVGLGHRLDGADRPGGDRPRSSAPADRAVPSLGELSTDHDKLPRIVTCWSCCR